METSGVTSISGRAQAGRNVSRLRLRVAEVFQAIELFKIASKAFFTRCVNYSRRLQIRLKTATEKDKFRL